MSNSNVVFHWVRNVAQHYRWYCTLPGTDGVLCSFQTAGSPQSMRHHDGNVPLTPCTAAGATRARWDTSVLWALVLLRLNSHPTLWKQRISEKGNRSITKDAAQFDNLPVRTWVITQSLYIYYLRTQARAVPNPSNVYQGLMHSFFADLALNTK